MTRHLWSALRVVEVGLFAGLLFFVYGCTDCGPDTDHVKKYTHRGKVWRIWYDKSGSVPVPLSIVYEDGRTTYPNDRRLPIQIIPKDGGFDVIPRIGAGESFSASPRISGPAAASPPYYAYILSDAPADALYILDQQTGLVAEVVPLPTLPQGLGVSPSGNQVYVTNQGIEAGNPFFPQAPPRVSVVDRAARRIVQRIDLTFGMNPGKPVVSPDDRFVYVPVGPDTRQAPNAVGGVAVIDAQTRALVATIPVSVPSSPLRRGVITPDGAILFVTAPENIPARVFVIDTFTRSQIAIITANVSLRDMLVDYTGSRLYLLTQTSLVAIDTSTLTEIATLPVRTPARLNNMALSMDGRSIFINDELSTSILRVSTVPFRVAETITFSGRNAPDSSRLLVVP